jgi:DNA segregation ATPase FtsK/SpoIIIE, S-DNA-T family
MIEVGGARHEVEFAQAVASATLADLVEQACGLLLSPSEMVWVDRRRCTAATLVRNVSLLEGSRIARSPLERAAPIDGWAASLSGGLNVGRTVPVPTNRPLVIGRSPEADLTVDSPSASWSHAIVEHDGDGLRVRDNGSTNGTSVDGIQVSKKGVLVDGTAVVLVGGAAISLRRGSDESLAPAPGTLHNLTQAATVPFNRPPRPGRPSAPGALEPPTRNPPPSPAKFGLAAILAPLLMAAVMVVVMRDLRFALMAALSPILAVGSTLEQKRRHRKDVREADETFTTRLNDFRIELDKVTGVERERRRDLAPDPAAMLRRAALPTTRLWQRRAPARDFLMLQAGVGNVPWKPPLDASATNRRDDEVKEVLEHAILPSAPIDVDLTRAGVVGVVGERDGALAVARSMLCQAATHCGPADLTVGIFCDQGREDDWSWSGWLPHVRRLGDGSGGQWVSTDRARSEALLRSLHDGIQTHPTPAVLLLLDSDVLTEGRDAPARNLLGYGRPVEHSLTEHRSTEVSGIVIASTEDQLPAACTTIVNVGHDGAGIVTQPGDLTTVDHVVLAGISVETARRWAADLARFDDPELSVPGAALPGLVRLPPLLGIDQLSAAAIRQSWSASRGISTPLGVGENGVFDLDLVRDGPHGLVGGTTGSGKSEFLRSLVAGLAALNDPTRLTFILIDFKGGAAFKTCERLPHTIGTVSNLDEQLADRALTALEAELRYRQQVFANAGEGVDNLDAYLATNPAEPMPRLLLVIDEFAMLAKDYPDVLKSLVSVAAVGRTLGVHMILATQRPAGVVNEDILANTNLRVALRVQSREDSVNVVGVPAAASIGRTQWGRAYIKLGQDDITPVQTALVTGRSELQTSNLVDVHPVRFGRDEKPKTSETAINEEAPTDLDLLIDAIVEANADLGFGSPRPVWPEPLGARVALAATESNTAREESVPVVGGMRGSVVEIAVADDPRQQRQLPVGWDLDRGNLMLLGIPGSGTSTTLASVALTLADAYAPDELDLLVLDLGTRDLAPLAGLPHTATYVGSGSGTREQQVRFLKYIRKELDRRRATPSPHRHMVILIDGLGALKDEYDDFDGLKLLEGLYRVYADGPDVQMSVAVATARSKAVPTAIDEVTTQKWLFRLADAYDYSSSGVPVKLMPPSVPGRCVLAESKLHAHVATPPESLSKAVAHVAARWGEVAPKPSVVGQLPTSITVQQLGVGAHFASEPWRLPVGVRESDLEPAMLEVYEGEHVLIAGPVRSGKSLLLLAIAESVRAAGIDVWGICGRRSPLSKALVKCAIGADGVAAILASARVHRGPLVLLVDDAEQFDDNDQAFAGLLSARTSDLLVVAAGRSDDLRGLYSHWTKIVRKARCGVLLQPNVDFDGELLGVTLPRRAPVPVTPGRGYMVSSGTVEFLQVMAPSTDGDTGHPAGGKRGSFDTRRNDQ